MSRNYLIAALLLITLYLMFFKPQTSGWCFGTCTGWMNVNDAHNYKCPSDKSNRKVSRNGYQVNCCKCP